MANRFHPRTIASGALLAVALALSCLRHAGATTTGLNNIPTAEVVTPGLLVFQQITNFGSSQESIFHLGFKYGPAPNWEIGLDDRVVTTGSGAGVAGAGGMPAGPTVLQVKYAANLSRPRKTSLGAGVANIGADSERAGDPFPYLVISRELGLLRGHLGHSWQEDNPAWFLGVDKAVGRGLTLRADWIQANDREESVSSLGFIQDLGGGWLVEMWGSFPTASAVADTLTLKFDCDQFTPVMLSQRLPALIRSGLAAAAGIERGDDQWTRYPDAPSSRSRGQGRLGRPSGRRWRAAARFCIT